MSEPIHCSYSITGPKVGRRVVAWRRRCRRRVNPPECYCWQHKPEQRFVDSLLRLRANEHQR